MLTKPDRFTESYFRSGTANYFVVKLTDGTSTWYFSQVDMQLGTTHVYDLVHKCSPIIEGFDWMTKAWIVSSVNITLINKEYRKNTSGQWVKTINDIKNIQAGDAASICLVAGSNVSSMTDCLERFVGVVAKAPQYDQKYIKIQLVHEMAIKNKVIPENLVGDVYPNAPPEEAIKKIPLIWGKFTFAGLFDSSFTLDGNGLAISIAIDSNSPAKIVVADHIIKAICSIQHPAVNIPEVYDPVFYINSSSSVNDSGRATATGDTKAYAYIMSKVDDDDYAYPEYPDATNPENACDRDSSTKADTKDNIDAALIQEGYSSWALESPQWIMERVDEGLLDFRIQTKCDSQIHAEAETKTIMSWLCRLGGDTKIANSNSLLTANNLWETGNDISSVVPSNKRVGATMNAYSYNSPDADGTINNFTMLHTYELRIRIKYKVFEHKNIFVQCDGRSYGSWITGRSSNFADGDCIEDPAGIIESILRDILSFASSDIDLTSFITAENTNVKARMNLHSENEMSVLRAIQQIAEQSTFAFIWGAAGKARLIPMNDTSPTTVRTIPMSHIVENSLKIGKTGKIINKMILASRWQPEYNNIFRDNDEYNNSASQTSFGAFGYNAQWPNLCGSPAQHVANHYIRKANGTASDDDGIWANQHAKITFETHAFLNADLECGDWIELDDATVDPQLKLYGATWASKQFLVVQLEQSMEKTKITAIQLF